jgi:hypothetical protein
MALSHQARKDFKPFPAIRQSYKVVYEELWVVSHSLPALRLDETRRSRFSRLSQARLNCELFLIVSQSYGKSFKSSSTLDNYHK